MRIGKYSILQQQQFRFKKHHSLILADAAGRGRAMLPLFMLA